MTKNNFPRLRFSEFNGVWNSEKLGELSDIVRGASPRPIKDKRWFSDTSEIGWIRISDVTSQNGKIRELAQHLSEEGQKKTRVLKSPHLLLSIAASVGKPVINYVPTGVHDGFLIFKNPKFNINYMYSYLDYFQNQWNKFGQPGSQVNLNSDLVKSLILYLPNKDEQDKISVFVSKMDKLIELQTQKLEQLKKLKQGYLQKVFPQDGESVPRLRFSGFSGEWKEENIGEIFDSHGGKSIEKYFDKNGKSKVISIGSYGENSQYVDQGIRVNKDDISNDLIMNPGELAMILNDKTSNGNIIGRTLLINDEGFVINQRSERLIPKNDDSRFLYYLLNYERKSKIFKISQGGTQIYVNFSAVKKLKLLLPSLKEQIRIASFFEKIDINIESMDEKIDSLKRQKKAYLQKMFI